MCCWFLLLWFQHTAARRRLVPFGNGQAPTDGFNTQPPEGGWLRIDRRADEMRSFNTQPPEGGWLMLTVRRKRNVFQHTAARRRLVQTSTRKPGVYVVSTHSRPKAAGTEIGSKLLLVGVSTHSRPKAAGYVAQILSAAGRVSTHSRPKAAGERNRRLGGENRVSTHSRPKAAGLAFEAFSVGGPSFNTQPPEGGWRVR